MKVWRGPQCQALSSNFHMTPRFKAHKVGRKPWKLNYLKRWVGFNRIVMEETTWGSVWRQAGHRVLGNRNKSV